MKGIPASRGIGIGKAVILSRAEDPGRFEGRKIESSKSASETERFKNAILAAAEELEAAKGKASEILEEKDVQVFQAYRMVLEDPVLDEMVTDNIQTRLMCAEAAVMDAVGQIKAMFLSIEDAYMRQRAEDVENVASYILDSLTGRKRIDLSHFNEDCILIAEDLTPADTVALDRAHVRGFAVVKGGVTSHTAIVARSLEIPAVVGCGEAILGISPGALVILDGEEGTVLADPSDKELDAYSARRSAGIEIAEKLKRLKDEPAQTTDGRRVELLGNIALPEEAAAVPQKGGDGVGLFRTEFLYLEQSKLPSEEEQYLAYKKAVEALGPRPCIIRTMDIGGDKQLKQLEIPAEANPFLGYRAIRICLREAGLFKTQLRALLRAAAHGNLSIMFPMISGVEEVRAAKGILDEARRELDEKGIPYGRDVKVGIMIEVPSAAMIADLLAREVDFFSIGSNDLCQYTLAVDRMNEKISDLYDPLHPGVLRLIKRVIDSGHEAGIKVGMCGEMASNAENAVLLLGLGLDEFSMAPSAIPYVKETLRSISYEKAREVAEDVMEMKNTGTIPEYIKERLLC